MKPSLILRRLRTYLHERKLARYWLLKARACFETGCRARGLNSLARYRAAKAAMSDSWQRLLRTHRQINLGTLSATTL